MRDEGAKYRIQRSDPVHIEDDSSHGWAVSYADLLMVLLSFFIIFFSQDEEKTSQIIKEISEKSWLTNPEDEPQDLAATPVDLEQVHSALSSKGLSLEKENQNLLMQFNKTLYKEGQIGLTKEGKDLLESTLEKLKAFEDKIEIHFIGHSDQKPISSSNKYLENNYDLSSLRASKALKVAVQMGFPLSHLVAQGWGPYRKSLRGLSLSVRAISPDYQSEKRSPASAKKENLAMPQKKQRKPSSFQSYPVQY